MMTQLVHHFELKEEYIINEWKYNSAPLTKTNMTYPRFKIKPYNSKAPKNKELEKGETSKNQKYRKLIEQKIKI